MKEDCPSKTALRAAMRRAAHQVLDDPKVFDDPLALRIFDVDDASALEPRPEWLEEAPQSRLLAMGFGQAEDITPEEMNSRHVHGRTDALRFGSLPHMMNARV